MNKYVIEKIRSNEKANFYLRENSYWYKMLNRKPLEVENMINEMKEKYGLRFKDKVDNLSNIVDILSALKDTKN